MLSVSSRETRQKSDSRLTAVFTEASRPHEPRYRARVRQALLSEPPLELAKIFLRGCRPGHVPGQRPARGCCSWSASPWRPPLMAIGAAIGTVIGPIVAALLKYDRNEIVQGIFGFNPTLVGIALLFYLRPVTITWLLVVVGSLAATVVTYLMRRFLPFPSYTAPFIVCTWLMVVIGHGIAGTGLDLMPSAPGRAPSGFVDAVLNGAAEVMFGENLVTGLLFIGRHRRVLLAACGARRDRLDCGDSARHVPSRPGRLDRHRHLRLQCGTLRRSPFTSGNPRSCCPILAAIVSVPLTEFFLKSLGVPPLTAPFVAAAWVVLADGSNGSGQAVAPILHRLDTSQAPHRILRLEVHAPDPARIEKLLVHSLADVAAAARPRA